MGAGHLLALTSLGVLALPLEMTIPLGILISVSLVISYIRHGRSPSPWFIDQLYWSIDGQWTLRTADARKRPARLLGSYVHPGLIVLSFALGRLRRRSVVLLPDSADPEAIRRLRVRLLTREDLD